MESASRKAVVGDSERDGSGWKETERLSLKLDWNEEIQYIATHIPEGDP
jgi:hypothetical protein